MIEVLFVIYLLSGTLKGILFSLQIHLGVDLTILTAIMLIAGLFFSTLKEGINVSLKVVLQKDRYHKLIPFLVFFLWCLFTLCYDTTSYPSFTENGKSFAFIKAFNFLTCLLPIVVLFLLPAFNVHRFYRIYIGVTILIAFFFLFFTPVNCEFEYFGQSFEGRKLIILTPSFLQSNFPVWYSTTHFDYSLVASDHLTVALLLGTSFLMLLSLRFSVFNFLLIILILFLQLSSDGRGPVLLLVITLLLLLFIKLKQIYKLHYKKRNWIHDYYLQLSNRIKKNHLKKVFYIVLFPVMLISLIMLSPSITGLYKKSFFRYLGIVQYSGSNELINDNRFKELNFDKKYTKFKHIDTSIMARQLHIKNSLQLIVADLHHFLFGYGFGNYAKASKFSLLINDHPHNVLLEIGVELGIIGLSLFLWFLYTIWKSARTNSYMLGIIVFYLFLNCMKSVPLVDRNIFAFYGLILFIGTQPLKPNSEIKFISG